MLDVNKASDIMLSERTLGGNCLKRLSDLGREERMYLDLKFSAVISNAIDIIDDVLNII